MDFWMRRFFFSTSPTKKCPIRKVKPWFSMRARSSNRGGWGLGDGDGMCIWGGLLKAIGGKTRRTCFFAFQIEMLYNRFLFNQKFYTFCYAVVDFPVANGWFVAASSFMPDVYDGCHLSVTNFQRKIICQGCEGLNSEAEAYFHQQFVSAKKSNSKKTCFRLNKFRMEMSNNLNQTQDLRLQ